MLAAFCIALAAVPAAVDADHAAIPAAALAPKVAIDTCCAKDVHAGSCALAAAILLAVSCDCIILPNTACCTLAAIHLAV